ncbi:hypothetical protein [Microbacterium sp. USHLN186]|uniref:hypothetical protein n=1 Tax=Microbacterium sp. USHLN186 TaxID=3081286 RepID=UPI003018A408
MSDDIRITSGGAIEADPAAFRAVGDRMTALAARAGGAADLLRRAQHALTCADDPATQLRAGAISASASELEQLATALAADAEGTRVMADCYELADLRARQQMLSVHRPAQAQALQQRIDELAASYAPLDGMATQLVAGWAKSAQQGLFDQPADVAVAAVLGWSTTLPARHMLGVIRRNPLSFGVIPEGEHLAGPMPEVTVTRLSERQVPEAARTMTETLSRIPRGEAQVAVERRTHADGSSSYAVYIDGTREFLEREEPWDMASNWQLYAQREKSASYAAVMRALELAGAQPGDRVDAVGFSQGGAVAGHVAMSGVYDVQLVTLVGTPTVPSLASDQTLVHLVHTDDLVGAGLTGGGPPGRTGSDASFTVSREFADGARLTSLAAHSVDAYSQTTRRAEASGDPRVQAYNARLAREAEQVVTVQRTEFTAQRGAKRTER